MLKSAFIYRLRNTAQQNANGLASALAAQSFAPCGATQDKSAGWIPPREANGPMLESVGGQWIAKLAIETKSVPKSEIDKHVAAAVDYIEQTTGRKPGKKERRELSEDALTALLPNAFAKLKHVPVWINPGAELLVIGAGSQSAADEVITALIRAVDTLAFSLIQTVRHPQGAMTDWLLGDHIDVPNGFSIERECVLKSNGEDAATVKFAKHSLDTPEVRNHITEGKLPTQMALSWEGRAAFVLTECLHLKKIEFLDGVLDASGADKEEDRFDADVMLATGLLTPMIDSLLSAMGGEVEVTEAE